MAHWAEIDENNIVLRVVVTNNEDEDEGHSWLIENHGGTWLKTSYNTRGGIHMLGGTPFRKNFAGIGHTYDPEKDAFIPPSIYPSWILNEETCLWEPPTPYPDGEGPYRWDESAQTWSNELDATT